MIYTKKVSSFNGAIDDEFMLFADILKLSVKYNKSIEEIINIILIYTKPPTEKELKLLNKSLNKKRD